MSNVQASRLVENCSLSLARCFLLHFFLLSLHSARAQSLGALNSSADELAPVFSPGGDSLFFVRESPTERRRGQDAWYSVRQADGSWGTPVRLPPPINNDQDNAVAGVSADGRTLYLTNVYRGRRMRPGVSVSHFDARRGTWSKPTALPVPGLDSVRGTLGLHVVGDSVLLLSMQAGAGTDHEDLFISRQLGDETWTVPQSLGEVVNSAGYEIAPFYSVPDSTLYFASDGHGGFGDSDLFRSRRLDASWQRWSVPENLGPALNTPAFEAYFARHPRDGRAYFVRADEATGDLHAVVYPLRQAPVPPTARPVPPTTDRGVEASRVTLPPVPTPVLILFSFGTYALPDSAESSLKFVLDYLQSDQTLSLEIIGYADAVGEEADNYTLAGQRTESIRRWLRERAVRSDRIRTRVEGEKKARAAAQAPDAARQPDRRVEIRLTRD
jgi:outer membrane protein OmpA-like peptidoglycan-associated protein